MILIYIFHRSLDREFQKQSASRLAIHRRLGQSGEDQDSAAPPAKHRKHRTKSGGEDGHPCRVVHEEQPKTAHKPKKIDLRNIIRPKADEAGLKLSVKRKSDGNEADTSTGERKKIRLNRPGRVNLQSVISVKSDSEAAPG